MSPNNHPLNLHSGLAGQETKPIEKRDLERAKRKGISDKRWPGNTVYYESRMRGFCEFSCWITPMVFSCPNVCHWKLSSSQCQNSRTTTLNAVHELSSIGSWIVGQFILTLKNFVRLHVEYHSVRYTGEVSWPIVRSHCSIFCAFSQPKKTREPSLQLSSTITYTHVWNSDRQAGSIKERFTSKAAADVHHTWDPLADVNQSHCHQDVDE